jgi:excisionase family DNA binding protein
MNNTVGRHRPTLTGTLEERRREGRLLTVQEAAAFLAVEVCTIRKWTHQRKLPVVKIMGRVARYRPSDLEALVRRDLKPALRGAGD